MKPTDIKIDQPWLHDPGAVAVMAAIGADQRIARYVGGCVRDALFGRPVRDIDIATELTPEQVMARLEEAGLSYAGTGLAHGTVTAIADGRGFEVTTLRHDVETDGRRASVAYTDDWFVDARRRDFSINALYADADGTIYDPVDGVPDIEAGLVRFIGTAEHRIEEDFLRILRFFRFHAWYGKGPLDPLSLEACIHLKRGLRSLSVERVRAELLRLLESHAPQETLRVMHQQGILGEIMPPPAGLGTLEAVVGQEESENHSDAIRRLIALYRGQGRVLQELAKDWKLSNQQKKRIKRYGVVVDAWGEVPVPSPVALRQMAYQQSKEAVEDWLLVRPIPLDGVHAEVMDSLRDWTVPEFPLAGADVLALGVGEGAAVGAALKAIEAQWIEGDFQQDRAALLALLKKQVAEG